ncbi:response regulator transcription factor [Helicobacter sp. 11S02629-2]|uniref:response regulator transcription factor n=1 Tax=Helicobacter sp. 11S02629-2 TaxID=1476195 RepID=UPI000BA59BB5|nr:response regulator transcription factor [Helicobacter sp. 11S02629-2]PAF45415.1 DNA-binding response regulator [Helicobacter sp. 11S02629-2]
MDLILCVDDELDLLELLEYNLERAGFQVAVTLDTKMAMKFIENEKVALIIMDRNLKNENGLNFILELKRLGYMIPTIFLSALSLPLDKVDGLKVADDYIAKPFDMDELLARIKAVLRRYSTPASELLKYKDLTLNLSTRELSSPKVSLDLSALECNLIACFFQNKNLILTRELLLEKVWGNRDYQENSVNVAIKRLRSKLKDKGIDLKIKSIRSEGYKLC